LEKKERTEDFYTKKRKKRENGKSAEKERITPGMFFFYLLSSFIHIAWKNL